MRAHGGTDYDSPERRPATVGPTRDILLRHAERYPLWGIDDLYKLIHQAAMGSEHAAADETAARAWLARELADLGSGPVEPLLDPISPDGSVVRIHLRPYVRLGLDAEPLLAAFLRTAREFRGSAERIEVGLAEAAGLARDGRFAFDEADVGRFFARMKVAGFPAVRHSVVFRAEYRPAYRVVARSLFPPELKERAESVFHRLGLNATQAITRFYKQVELRDGLPFDVSMARFPHPLLGGRSIKRTRGTT